MLRGTSTQHAASSRSERLIRRFGFVALIVLFAAGMAVPQIWKTLADRPNTEQRIVATLVGWGLSPEGIAPQVSDEAIAERIDALRSPYTEDRVRAAHWLAAHGVRDAADDIAMAMADPRTARPCQLAHALGHLGDDRWTDELVIAANQRGNTDLRVCATIGLKSLASSRSVEALIHLLRDDLTRATAIEALGNVGDQRALPPLRKIATTNGDEYMQRAASLAIERIEALNSDDPVVALERALRASLTEGRADDWALRWLAKKADPRVVDTLHEALTYDDLGSDDRAAVAATLLMIGDQGRRTLHTIASTSKTGSRTALAALRVLTGGDEINKPSWHVAARE